MKGKTGLREPNGQKSKYCSKRTLESEFENLIANANFRYIFLSYNNEGLMNVDAIKNIMSRYGIYRCFTQSYRRFKADKDKTEIFQEKKRLSICIV